jgi:hypothetical protein
VLVLDLRLLGFWRGIALRAIVQPTVPVAAIGFGIAVLSGVGLLATQATDYVGNPFLYIKFPAIGLGLVNVVVFSRLTAWKQHKTRDLSSREQTTLAVFGGISLVCWLTAITAGRLIAYW